DLGRASGRRRRRVRDPDPLIRGGDPVTAQDVAPVGILHHVHGGGPRPVARRGRRRRGSGRAVGRGIRDARRRVGRRRGIGDGRRGGRRGRGRHCGGWV